MIDPGIINIAQSDDSMAVAALRVDIIADLICPWCYLGKRRLDDALLAVRGPSVVNWIPFQLNPDMPADGMAFDDYLLSKFGHRDTIQPGLDYLTEAGRAEGIHFRFDQIKRVPRTLEAHQLMLLADQEGADTSALAERILQGFFEQGLDISARQVLLMMGEQHGLSADAINKALDDNLLRQRVLELEAQVRRGGVTGVPDFLINRRLFIMGAQKTEVLVDVFDRAMFGEASDQPVSPTIN